MSSPYPPQPPKRLERSKSNRILGGVCAGVANYLNMDPTLVRVLTVVISLFTGVPVILYIIALFVVPEEGSQPASATYPPVSGPQGQASGFPTAPPQPNQPVYTSSGMSGPTQPAQQPTPPVFAEDSVWGTEGAPWEQRQPAPESTTEPAFGAPPPSEPEPGAPAAHEADAFESVPEPEGPDQRTAGTDSPATEPGGPAESSTASEGDQQPDRP
jgi:phage shock protein PspC (stress-responsive transcriptional regulator)